MNATLIIIVTIAVIIVVISCIYIYNLSRLKFYKSRVDSSIIVINEELENRYKLIQDSKTSVEKSTKKDLDFYKELETIKNTNITSYELDRKITEAINTLYLIKNDFPKLADKKDFKELVRKLNESDTKITAAKSYYNKNNDFLVGLLKKFIPGFVGKVNKIKILPFYDTVELFEEDVKDIEE